MKNKILNKNILVIGDSIIDKDIYVSDLGKSLETDSTKTKYIDQSIMLGGASRLVNFISIDTINEYDPDYFIFTKLMTGRFCWLDKIVTCREDIREDLKINTKETLKYFLDNKKMIFQNNDVIIFKN